MSDRQMMTDEELNAFLDTGEIPEWAAERAKERAAMQASCDHAGWNWKQHGRCCFTCGAFMIDWGD